MTRTVGGSPAQAHLRRAGGLRARGERTARDAGHRRAPSRKPTRRWRSGATGWAARIGAGGFGTVYEARDERLGRGGGGQGDPRRRPRRRARPARGARRGAARPPGHRLGVRRRRGGRLALPRLRARARARRWRSSRRPAPSPTATSLRIGLALADALAHAHERGVIHRDVKPQNVMVPDRPRSPYGAAKLTDFGVAHLAGDEPLTRTGDVVGTLAYMAPEQAAGERVDERVRPLRARRSSSTRRWRASTPCARARRPPRCGASAWSSPPLAHQARRPAAGAVRGARSHAAAPPRTSAATLVDLADALAEALPEVSDDGGTLAPHPLEDAYELPPLGRPRRRGGRRRACWSRSRSPGSLPDSSLPAAAPASAPRSSSRSCPRGGWIARRRRDADRA